MRIYTLGCLFLIFLSCNNAGGGKSQRRDALPAPLARDTPFVLDARDTPAPMRAKATLPASEKDTTPPQAITLAKRPPGLPVDTVLDIDIDDVSLEGSEVTANYVRDTLRIAKWEIFGETFQSQVTYTFSWDGKVRVKDRFSKYKVRMGDVKSDNDMITDSTTYQLDTNGVLLSGGKPNFDLSRTMSLFTSFKENVPMILRP